MHLPHYIGLLHNSADNLADAFREISEAHAAEPDVHQFCRLFAGQCDDHVRRLIPFVDRYGERAGEEPERLHLDLFQGTRRGGLGMLRDLHDLYLMTNESDITWTMLGQAAQGIRDTELLEIVNSCEVETAQQLSWLRTRMKQAAPQALIASS
ncbi:MAG: hypothetical protein ACOC9Y_04120 [Chloroflexota bacterium]